jgi:hypothetical protein
VVLRIEIDAYPAISNNAEAIPNVVLIANLSLFIIDTDRKLQGMI